MKKLLIIIMILVLVVLIGCDSKPKPPPEAEGIVCKGGIFSVRYGEWTQTGCEGSMIQAGTFWQNKDGRIFLLGEVMDIKKVREVFGDCPTSFVKEIVISK